MSTPLFYYKSTIVHVDDNLLTLKAVRMSLGDRYNVVSIQDPKSCINYIDNYISPLSKINLLSKIDDSEKFDSISHAPVNFEIDKIMNFMDQIDKHDEISLLIIDYEMPGINGVELCEILKKTSIKKILLTAHADYKRATEAHNNKLIDRFIIKDTPNSISKNLSIIADELIRGYFFDNTKNLIKHLSISNSVPFEDNVFEQFFNELINTQSITEYHLIDKNGSCLLIDSHGNRKYLIIHTNKSLDDLVNTYIYIDELPIEYEGFLDSIAQRKSIPFWGMNKTLDDINIKEIDRYLYIPNIIRGKIKYYWCIVSSN